MANPVRGDANRRLTLFNAKAAKLNGSRFLAATRSGRRGYSINGKIGVAYELESHLPEDEDIESYVLTLRLFFQPRDRIDLGSIADAYQALPISNALKVQARDISEAVERYLDGMSPIIIDRQQLTRRIVWETIMYGGLAHANPDKYPTYDTWKVDELKRVLTHDEFVGIALALTQAVFNMRLLNLEAIKELES